MKQGEKRENKDIGVKGEQEKKKRGNWKRMSKDEEEIKNIGQSLQLTANDRGDAPLAVNLIDRPQPSFVAATV